MHNDDSNGNDERSNSTNTNNSSTKMLMWERQYAHGFLDAGAKIPKHSCSKFVKLPEGREHASVELQQRES